jgi:hypothetical protein
MSPSYLIIIFFNSHSGGWSPSWVLGTSSPAPGDCKDGEFGGMKIGRETEVLGENLPQRHFVHHKSHFRLRDRLSWLTYIVYFLSAST